MVCVCLILLLGKASAVTILESPPTETPTPDQSQATSSEPEQKRPPNNQEQGWVAPSNLGSENPFHLTLNSAFQNDVTGFQGYSLLDIYAKRDLNEYSVRAEGMIRLKKSLSNSDAT